MQVVIDLSVEEGALASFPPWKTSHGFWGIVADLCVP